MRSTLLALALSAWLAALGVGADALWSFKTTPGKAADAPEIWPSGSQLVRVPGAPTLVVIVHPRCPCSRATLDELNTLMNQLHGQVTAYVLFVVPDGTPPGWVDTDTWRRAHEIPGVTVVEDDRAAEGDRFGAWTSGQVLVYDSNGRLEFSGGITALRGHVGDNLGSESIRGLVGSGGSQTGTTPVFGCPLHDPADPASNRDW